MCKDFGTWMREMRKSKKMSQMRLAEKIGVHYNSIMRWETGTQFPPLDVAEMIICEFGHELLINKGETT